MCRLPQNIKTLLQVVVAASVQACMVIKCFHYLYESPQQRGTARQAAAVVSTSGLTEWPDFLLRVFWNWRRRRRQQALTESCHCRVENLPQTLCLWPGLWRCMSLLDVSCQLALGTLDSILALHVSSSDSRGRWWVGGVGRGDWLMQDVYNTTLIFRNVTLRVFS